MKTAASIKTLMELKDIDQALAKRIRFLWKEITEKDLIERLIKTGFHVGPTLNVDYGQMWVINGEVSYHGVEFLGWNHGGEEVHYLNAGDAYTPTIIFIGDSRLIVKDYGSLIESKYLRENKQW